MPGIPPLSQASLPEISHELSRRCDEFILIHRDKVSDEWVINLDERLDGILVAELLNIFQGRVLQLMRNNEHEASNKLAS